MVSFAYSFEDNAHILEARVRVRERYRLSEKAAARLKDRTDVKNLTRELMSVEGIDYTNVRSILNGLEMGGKISDDTVMEIYRKDVFGRVKKYRTLEDYEKGQISPDYYAYLRKSGAPVNKDEENNGSRFSRVLRYAAATATLVGALALGSLFNNDKTKQAEIKTNAAAVHVQKASVKNAPELDRLYEIENGDCLSVIAHRLLKNRKGAIKEKQDYMVEKNPWLAENPDLIYPGDVLKY